MPYAKIFQSPHRLAILFLIIVGIPLLASYNGITQLEVIKQQGELKVITRLSPTTYFTEDGNPGGSGTDTVEVVDGGAV